MGGWIDRRIDKHVLSPGCAFNKGTVLEAGREREEGGRRRKGREGGTNNGSGMPCPDGNLVPFFQEPFSGDNAATKAPYSSTPPFTLAGSLVRPLHHNLSSPGYHAMRDNFV